MEPGFRGLKVYQLSYRLAMEIFQISKQFPPDERFGLTDQIRRSSRGVCTNTAEGYRKRRYKAMFVNKMGDSDAEATETQVHLDFARDCGYIDASRHAELLERYVEVGKMLGSMILHPEKFSG